MMRAMVDLEQEEWAVALMLSCLCKGEPWMGARSGGCRITLLAMDDRMVVTTGPTPSLTHRFPWLSLHID